jgi:PadR family transcriptional regulator PadR
MFTVLTLWTSPACPAAPSTPHCARLEKESLVSGDWEDSKIALRQDRPPRRYYKLTRQGKDALINAVERYPLLAKLAPEEKVTRR